MKYLHIFLALMFLAFAALQINDPDPALWILIYVAMIAVCVMAIFEYYNKIVLTVLAVSYTVYCIILWPGVAEWFRQDDKSVLFDDVMKMEYPYIEESREFLGLVICLLVLVFYFLRSTNLLQTIALNRLFTQRSKEIEYLPYLPCKRLLIKSLSTNS